MRLPNEILDTIFAILFGHRALRFSDASSLAFMFDSSDEIIQKANLATAFSIMLTSRQLYARALSVLYTTTTFMFFQWEQLSHFVTSTGPNPRLIKSVSVEMHLTQRIEDVHWAAALNRALKCLTDLRCLNVHVYIEHGDFSTKDWTGPPEGNEPVLFSTVPYRPPMLKEVNVIVVARDTDWLDFVGISMDHLFDQEKDIVLGKQAEWIEKVTARLLGWHTAGS